MLGRLLVGLASFAPGLCLAHFVRAPGIRPAYRPTWLGPGSPTGRKEFRSRAAKRPVAGFGAPRGPRPSGPARSGCEARERSEPNIKRPRRGSAPRPRPRGGPSRWGAAHSIVAFGGKRQEL